MGKIASSLGRAIALFIPTWLFLYSNNLYALNYFALPSTYEAKSAIIYGIYCIGKGLVGYILLVGVWWGFLNVFWRNHPDWISPKSWKNIFINWAIASACLFLAFLLEPSLWKSGNVLINGAISNSEDYFMHMTTSKFSSVFIGWFYLASIVYLIKPYLMPLPSTAQNINNYDSGASESIVSDDRPSRAELRLSAYLFYDEEQARRLVDGVQARYPDMPRKWCAEKALSDLERDRQSR